MRVIAVTTYFPVAPDVPEGAGQVQEARLKALSTFNGFMTKAVAKLSHEAVEQCLQSQFPRQEITTITQICEVCESVNLAPKLILYPIEEVSPPKE